MLDIDLPDVLAEVTAAFMQYEKSLGRNDLDTVDRLFWNSEATLRYGANGTLNGHAAISAFRRARDIKGIVRRLENTRITTFGRDFAVANTEYHLAGSEIRGRQSQTWVRLPEGWRIVSAHVSDEPAVPMGEGPPGR